MLRITTALLTCLLVVCGCNPQHATVAPSTSQIAGHYATTDPRAPAATLDVRADGTFTLANWPGGANGAGTWKIEQNNTTKRWEFNLVFGGNNYVSGQDVLGGPGHYRLGFFIGDPDEGAVVFERQKP
jgi:hypothetical protein